MSKIIFYRHLRYLQLRHFSGKRNKNHYDTLKIPSTSTHKEIKEAYIKLSKEKHPDVTGKKDHDEFAKINEAYSVLGNQNSRKDYDDFLKYQSVGMKNYQPYSEYYTYNTYEAHKRWKEKMGQNYEYADINEDNRSNFYRKATFISTFCLISVITFLIQVSIINNSLLKQKNELRRYMKAMREKRDKAYNSENKKDYENYINELITSIEKKGK